MLISQISNLYSIQHYINTTQCYQIVKYYSERYWDTRPKNQAHENYRFDPDAPSHALGPMLLCGKFFGGYTIVFKNDTPISFAGIRKMSDDIAIVLARNFCFHTVKPITNGIILPFQLNYCKQLGFTKAWTTVNDYNISIFDVWYKKEYAKRLDRRSRKRDDPIYIESDRCIKNGVNIGKQVVNKILQTVVEWNLTENHNDDVS